MAKIKYTYCKNCKTEMDGVAKVCAKCGQSAYLAVYEREAKPPVTQTDTYKKLPQDLRNLYSRVYSGDWQARLQWYDLIRTYDPRLKQFYDAVDCISLYSALYAEGCAEAAYMLGVCFKMGVERTTPFNLSVEPNLAKAYEWFTKSSQGKYYPALVALGEIVEENNRREKYGDGLRYSTPLKNVSTNLNMAAHFYSEAAKHGVPEGKSNYQRLAAMGYRGFPGMDF